MITLYWTDMITGSCLRSVYLLDCGSEMRLWWMRWNVCHYCERLLLSSPMVYNHAYHRVHPCRSVINSHSSGNSSRWTDGFLKPEDLGLPLSAKLWIIIYDIIITLLRNMHGFLFFLPSFFLVHALSRSVLQWIWSVTGKHFKQNYVLDETLVHRC